MHLEAYMHLTRHLICTAETAYQVNFRFKITFSFPHPSSFLPSFPLFFLSPCQIAVLLRWKAQATSYLLILHLSRYISSLYIHLRVRCQDQYVIQSPFPKNGYTIKPTFLPRTLVSILFQTFNSWNIMITVSWLRM